MAVESNNFLDEKTEPVSHKLMAKYVALAAVIFVILILCVLAWFASRPEADARGKHKNFYRQRLAGCNYRP